MGWCIVAVFNLRKAEEIANILKNAPDGKVLNFYSFTGDKEQDPVSAAMYPALYHPQAVDFFFLACAHQYGFWIGDDKGYETPLYGTFNGKQTKGSDALWRSIKRAMDADPEIVTPKRLATISYDDVARKLFSDDNGVMPYPDLEHRFVLTRGYAAQMMDFDLTPAKIVSEAQKASASLESFLSITSDIAGYNDDLLLKKNQLLAMALANRPEKFLTVTDEETWYPVVDYHLQRLALRLGGVEVNAEERENLENKEWTTAETERNVRDATGEFWLTVQEKSGKSHAQIDLAAWSARRFCPETEAPKCEKCVFNAGCDHQTKLFQPVLRTDAY